MERVMLNEVEQRIIGVLIEKAYTQPQYYPLTLKALVSGCNQKSNRDPMMDIDEDAAWSALDELRRRDLIAKVLPAVGSRADRFKHLFDQALELGRKETALLAELLLRGPQTAGELRSRGKRMASFESLEVVSNLLEALRDRTPPLVAPLPREKGKAAVRFKHLLDEVDEADQSPAQ